VDGTSLPYPDASFDLVVSQFTFMMFKDRALGIREAFRVLRPGGVLVFSTWDRAEVNPW
jgi:ubiquinone/menaquinone biosynthesis C-methylase UbiE